MFGSGKGVEISAEENRASAKILIQLLKSDKGKEIFLNTIKTFSSVLEKKLKGFSQYLEKENLYILFPKDLQKEDFEAQIDKFKSDIDEMPNSEIDRMLKSILDTFTLFESISIEALIIGFYQEIKRKMVFYDRIIRLREETMIKKNNIDEIIKEIRNNNLTLEIYKVLGGKIEIDREAPSTIIKEKEGEIANDFYLKIVDIYTKDKKKLESILEENFLSKIDVKKRENFEKRLAGIRMRFEYETQNSKKDIDDSIYDIVERIFFDISKERKNLIRSDLIFRNLGFGKK